MASWQAYVDSQLIASGYVDEAGIFSKDGKDNWASSAGFKVLPAELQVIVGAFKDADTVYAAGIKINGEKYTVFKADEKVLMGRKGKQGIVIVLTSQALILAHHPDTVATQQCAQTAEQLGDYLTSVGY